MDYYAIIWTALALYLIVDLVRNIIKENKDKKKIQSVPLKRKTPVTPYVELVKILDSVITTEVRFKKDEYTLNQILYITDYEYEVKQMTLSITESLSEDFMDDLYYYHSEKFILTYITRGCRDFLMAYQTQNRIKK